MQSSPACHHDLRSCPNTHKTLLHNTPNLFPSLGADYQAYGNKNTLVKWKVKVKLTVLLKYAQHYEDVWERRIASHIPDFGTIWTSVVSLTPWPLYHRGKYQLNRRLGRTETLSGRSIEEKNLSTGRESNTYSPVVQPVVYLLFNMTFSGSPLIH